MEKAITVYAAKDKEVKARAQADKQRWLNDLTKEAKTEARNKCNGDLY